MPRSPGPFNPDLVGRLPTFHHEPELLSGSRRQVEMSAPVRTVFGVRSLAAAGSTVTGTLRSIRSSQLHRFHVLGREIHLVNPPSRAPDVFRPSGWPSKGETSVFLDDAIGACSF